MGYKTSTTIDDALIRLENGSNGTCSRIGLGRPTHEGKQITGARIRSGSDDAIPVLVIGGVHARELAPPDALLSFCEQLVTAFENGFDIVLSATSSGGVDYPEHVIPNATVASLVEAFDLWVFPCVNPDGRDFALASSAQLNKTWRKNRRPDDCIGVDINRNFPIAWDAARYYTPLALPTVHTSTNPCDESFRGYTDAPVPLPHGPEPETENLTDLIGEFPFEYFVDIHMFGRKILWPWGMERDQVTNTTQTFTNPAFDHLRDALQGNAYGEYIPDTLVDPRGQLRQRLQTLATAMADEIVATAGADATARARSAYTPEQSIGLYPTTGASDDYAFSTQFLDPNRPNVHAFTIEAGQGVGGNPFDVKDDDGGFWPDFVTQFPKVEREIHAALYGLLRNI